MIDDTILKEIPGQIEIDTVWSSFTIKRVIYMTNSIEWQFLIIKVPTLIDKLDTQTKTSFSITINERASIESYFKTDFH